MTYCASPIKRKRRTAEQIAQLNTQLFEVLKNDHPQSVRHAFYRMTDPRLPEPVEKSEKGYRTIQNRLVELRRAGRLPYGWVTDATRRGYFTNTYQNAADFVRAHAVLYRADLWQNSPYYCEVWVESRSIAGVVQRLCEDLAVSLYPAGGFTSLSLAFQAATYINQKYDGREVVVFYVGDYDPAGVLIDVSIERELRQHLDDGVSLRFERIGITSDQIAEYDLPTKPRKLSDRRARHIERTVEAEAMPANTLRQLLRDRIEALLPENALAVCKVAEESEREYLNSLAESIEGDRQ